MEIVEIERGETRTVEFKKELPQDSSKWIKTIVAFANGAGGKLLIGVSNKREIIGIPQDTDIFALRDKISDTIAQMCEPQVLFDIYQESVADKVIVVVEVFPGNDTPYFIKSLGKENGTFIRLNATTRNADFTTLDELELSFSNGEISSFCTVIKSLQSTGQVDEALKTLESNIEREQISVNKKRCTMLENKTMMYVIFIAMDLMAMILYCIIMKLLEMQIGF